jgi:hypothetical protein
MHDRESPDRGIYPASLEVTASDEDSFVLDSPLRLGI